MKITDIFNAQDIPRFDRNAPGFAAETMRLIRDSRLVMIFDRAANPNTLAVDVADTQEKTYLSNFTLVSRDTRGSKPVYKQGDVQTPYWSGDAMATAAARGNPGAQWRREFLNNIVRAWDKMHRELTATVTFSKSFVISSEMSEKEKDDVAHDNLHKLIKEQMDAGEKKIQASERERSFDGDRDTSMVHSALSSLMQRPDKLEAFIYLRPEMNATYMRERLVKAANLFQIPAGTDFNGKPMVAFPGDDVPKSKMNTKAAWQKLSL